MLPNAATAIVARTDAMLGYSSSGARPSAPRASPDPKGERQGRMPAPRLPSPATRCSTRSPTRSSPARGKRAGRHPWVPAAGQRVIQTCLRRWRNARRAGFGRRFRSARMGGRQVSVGCDSANTERGTDTARCTRQQQMKIGAGSSSRVEPGCGSRVRVSQADYARSHCSGGDAGRCHRPVAVGEFSARRGCAQSR
jgi:hypothetical protein